MLTLFPKFKKRMIIFEVVYVALMVTLYLLKPTASPIALVLMLIVGVLFIAAAQYVNAVNTHNRQLNRLYNQLDVEGFLKEYEPHLQQSPKNPGLFIMVRMHLSNAYAAQGRFEDAIKLLTSTPIKECKKHEQTLMNRFAVTSNLCYCAEQMGDLDTAKKYLDALHGYKKELEEIQKTKKPKQRMVFSCELNDQCLKLLTAGKCDIQALKTQVQGNNTQQLHRITTSLWIARAYLAEQNRREAENILQQSVKRAPELYTGKEAARMLAELPAKAEN